MNYEKLKGTKMKRIWIGAILILCSVGIPVQKAKAQLPILEIIRQGVIKVIVAVDLKIQRLQNETIWLQNAQKTMENELSKLKLEEISTWVERQRKLYDDYFQELWKIKASLAYYHRVKSIIEVQLQLINEYKSTWVLLRRDKNFTPDELDHMYQVYSGMLEESGRIIDGLLLVVNSFATQMSDAKRLEIIDAASEQMEETFMNLREFNNQNKMISLNRAVAKGEIEYARKLYGLQ
jgi:hypothetical protein